MRIELEKGCFEGEARDGKPNGYGILTLTNGDRFEGTFLDGKRNGHGIYYFKNGDKYGGDWQDDRMPFGNSLLTFANGDTYKTVKSS